MKIFQVEKSFTNAILNDLELKTYRLYRNLDFKSRGGAKCQG